MEHIKRKKFTLLGIFIFLFYRFIIWPCPEHYPLLTHHITHLLMLLLVGALAYLDEQTDSKDR